MDWMTLSIELVGLLILGIWIVIPIAEFRQILARLRPRENRQEGKNDR
jgi:hypothetical protein